MKLVVNNNSMIPIYEQIVNQIKSLIIEGQLTENQPLPSVRSLSRELKISALTVKKAYDFLEREDMIVTIHGKGSYVSSANVNILDEERKKEVQKGLEETVKKAFEYGLNRQEIIQLFQIIMEENYDKGE